MPTLRQLSKLASSSRIEFIVSIGCSGVRIRVNGFRSSIVRLGGKKRSPARSGLFRSKAVANNSFSIYGPVRCNTVVNILTMK